MNREEMNWLLETIKEPEHGQAFVLAQLECGRISPQVMADIAQERGWAHRTGNLFLPAATCPSAEYATTGLAMATAC